MIDLSELVILPRGVREIEAQSRAARHTNQFAYHLFPVAFLDWVFLVVVCDMMMAMRLIKMRAVESHPQTISSQKRKRE